MIKKYGLLILTFFGGFFSLMAQEGYKIEITMDNYDSDTLLMGYHYGDKQYIKDTCIINSDGKFLFQGEESLDPGVYLVVMRPDNNYFQLLIDNGDQHFSAQTDAKAPTEKMQLQGSKENELFYGYMSYLAAQRPKAQGLQEKIKAASEAEKVQLQGELKKINESVTQYQKDLINNNKSTLAAAFVKSFVEAPMPEFKGNEKDVQMQRYRHYKAHYFDNIDLGDGRLVRSPFLFQRVDYYLNKLTPQHPDSINVSIDYLLGKMTSAEDTYKYYLVHFLNTYAGSKIVGMDAVYVHIAEKYYATGKAPWTEEEQLKKIVDNGKALKPLLIGKIAPDVKMMEIDIEGTIAAEEEENEYKRWKSKRDVTLHETPTPYTVLFIWDPDCGHCKKSMPKMIEFYENYRDKGVEVFAVCSKIYDGIVDCAKYIKEKDGMINWINAIDPFIKSKYKTLYDIKSTPQIYILDDKKEIISKRIGAEQIAEVMDKILEMKEKEAKGE